jgi:hypothetical protein
MNEMSWERYIFWGFASTIVLTLVMRLSRDIGYTRMDIPLMLGTIFTSNRDKAKWLGFLFHLVMGWLFSFFYVVAFVTSGLFHWWFGLLIGLIHGLFILVVGMSILPSIHPRMATEHQGPDPTHQLEPPGFLALNYGRKTPIVTLFAHLVYGTILGFFYHSS